MRMSLITAPFCEYYHLTTAKNSRIVSYIIIQQGKKTWDTHSTETHYLKSSTDVARHVVTAMLKYCALIIALADVMAGQMIMIIFRYCVTFAIPLLKIA